MSNYRDPKLVVKAIFLLTSLLTNAFPVTSSCAATLSDDADIARPRIALALGGGGTRGIAHIGVLRVFEKEGIAIDSIAGTSMGALVGGLYCAGLSPSQLEDIFHNRAIIDAFDTVPIPVRIALIPITILPRLIGFHAYEGLYRGNKFAKFISHMAPVDMRNIETLRPHFWAIASDLLDGQAHAIKKGDLGRAVQASSAIPILRRPVEIDNMLLVDGGVLENVPTRHARLMGCDYVIAVDVDEQIMPMAAVRFRALGSVSNRVLNINLAKIDEPQLAMADAVIQPDLRGIPLLSHKAKDAQKAIAAGEEAARNAVPFLKAQLSLLQNTRKKESEKASTVDSRP